MAETLYGRSQNAMDENGNYLNQYYYFCRCGATYDGIEHDGTENAAVRIRYGVEITADHNPVQDGDTITFAVNVLDEHGGSNRLDSDNPIELYIGSKKFTVDSAECDTENWNYLSELIVQFTIKWDRSWGNEMRWSLNHQYEPIYTRERTYDDDGVITSETYTEIGKLTDSFALPMTNAAPTVSWTLPTLFAGASATIRWNTSDSDGDTVLTTKLIRHTKAEGASSFAAETLINNSTSNTSYTDEIPESAAGSTVYYELVLSDGYTTAVALSGQKTVIMNTAPATPGKPVIPTEINGGSTIDITWTASTDGNGNLEGYKLERSLNGGSSWTQVYQGSANSTQNTVAAGTESVMYRVKAYDSYGAESAYATGSQVIVNNNNAPPAPASITVPMTVVGGRAAVISWTASADPDGDAVEYKLERSVDGGSVWDEIYSGGAVTYTDTVSADWASVVYRVAAVDSKGGASGYVTSNEREVIANFAPVLTLNNAPDGMDWGVVSAAPSISFSATDPDGDAVSVAAYVDGAFRRSCSASGIFNFTDSSGVSFWNQILNGKHTLTITASDGKESVSQSITFTKKVTECSITLKEPMTAEEQIKVCVLTVNGYFPTDCELTVEVTNNALDDAPAWENVTAKALSGMNHAFSNAVQVNGWAFNFRISAKEGSSGEGGYIASVQGGFQ